MFDKPTLINHRPFLVTVDRQKKIGYNKKDMKTAKKAPGKKPLQ